MPREIYLVKVGMTMTEGMVSEWFIADGAEVKKGDMLYALETEKVNLDVDAEADGIVKHVVEVGINMEPGDVVGYIFEPGETVTDVSANAVAPSAMPESVGQAEQTQTEAKQTEAQPDAMPVASSAPGATKSSPAARRLARELGVAISELSGSGPGGRIIERDVAAASKNPAAATNFVAREIKASPLARRIAAEKGIDLGRIQGTGPGGRIVQSDLDQPLSSQAVPSVDAAGPQAGEIIPLKGMRKTIAQRMHQSLMESAQLTMDMSASMDDTVKLRGQLINEWEGVSRPSFTDLVVKATAKALKLHPRMNSQMNPDGIHLISEVHIGIAVALPEGLVVPVIRNADQLGLKELAIESARLAKAAKEGTLGLDDYSGGTFTISALGMYGVDSFTPIINQPQSGILGVNQIFEGLAWDGDTPVKQKQMNLSLTWDHRVLDGAPAAEFLQSVVKFLEEPYRLLL
ncbi:MAG: pyruvate/2-oxoglutarate dehydrogenase complex dihydrolipoamide acyltransferase (E2) component [Candidatus Azotimanducaceae bacterium]|jgi:pyruvate/2-oxoglutarate dehydrogenase complex dihydrolipoamide acyltransferase (E2) component